MFGKFRGKHEISSWPEVFRKYFTQSTTLKLTLRKAEEG